MSEILGFPLHMAIAIAAVALAYLIAVHSPVLFALAIAWRQRKTMKRRILFVGSVMVASYGFLVVFFMAVAVPVAAFSIYIVPALKEQGYLQHSLFLAVVDFTYQWWWLMLPLASLVSAILTSRYFSHRWNKIIEALNGSQETHSN